MSERKLVVMVERAQRDKIADVAAALAKAGMTVEQLLDSVGIITGHAKDTSITALGTVEGVESLRDDGILRAINESGTDTGD